MSKKKIMITSIVIISLLLIISIVLSIVVSNYNKNLKSKRLNVVIYQYHTNLDELYEDPKIVYKEEMTNELDYEIKLYALDGDNLHDYNVIIIKDGIIRVIEADCKEQRCVHTIIDINNKSLSIFNPNTTTIECRPHGLKITLEEIEWK